MQGRLRRETPLRRKALHPKRIRAARCKETPVPELHNSRCDRRSLEGIPWCKSHARLKVDIAVRDQILERDGWTCQSGRSNHKGSIQWAHLVTRGALSTRWLPENSVALCAGCHDYYTHRPNEWHLWMVERIGLEGYWALLHRSALPEGPPDYVALLEDVSGSVPPNDRSENSPEA